MDVFTNAVISGDCDVVDTMLANAYKPSLYCLETACKHGHLDIVTRLLGYCCWKGHFLNEAFQTAVVNHHDHLLNHLYLAGADINYAKINNGFTSLHYAPDVKTAVWLLDMGARYVDCDKGFTPLAKACSEGNLDLVNLYLSRGAEQTPDKQGNMPLHHAAFDNHIEVVKLLLNNSSISSSPDRNYNSCNTNVFNRWLLTPLHYTPRFGNIELAQLLLEHGAIHTPDKKGKYPIYYACKAGNHQLVKLFIRYGSPINSADVNLSNYRSPLKCACKFGNTQCVRVLLEHGAVQNTQVGTYTYLHRACFFGYLDIVSLLLKHGGQQVPDDNGNTPLLTTMKWNGIDKRMTFEITEILISHGALQTSNNKGITPLHMACKTGKGIEILRILLSSDFYKENLQLQDNKGNTPLHALCEGSTVEKLKLLLDYGFKQLPNNNGNTPFHVACEELSIKKIKILLKYGAIKDCVNEYRQTPFDLAVQATIWEINTGRFNLDEFNAIRSMFGRGPLSTLPGEINMKTLSL